MTMTDMQTDWRYSEDRMCLRQDAFLLLMGEYFKLKTIKYLYEFCDHWVSQGNQTTQGIQEAFKKYLDDTIKGPSKTSEEST